MNFSFCPKCKGVFKKQHNKLLCRSCAFEWYYNPKPTNAAVLENDTGEILFVKRKVAPKKGFWDLPGGFIDIKETAEDSTRREIKEELGIDVEELSYIGSYLERYLYQKINYYILAFAFSGKVITQKITPDDDVSETTFFPKDKLPWKKFAFKSMKKIIRDYLKRS